MSKHNNVNPGQYKVAGRERPGDDLPEAERSPGTAQHDEQAQQRWDERQKKQQEKGDESK